VTPSHIRPVRRLAPLRRRSRTAGRSHRLAAGSIVLATVLAACGGGGDDGAAVTTVAPDTTAPATTEAAVDTTTASTEPATTAADAPTTTVGEAGPVMPLTGLPIDDDVVAARPAMVVKIDNHPQARPQFGINGADIVFEENVENLTRFAAVFHTNAPAKVGPIRSGRTQDVDLLGSLVEPLFVWSGGNPRVVAAINGSDLISITETIASRKGMFREKRGNEDKEHTLYADTTEIWANFTPVFNPPPPAQFTYRAADEAFNGEESGGVDLEMDGVDVTWTWDADSSSYLRDQDGKPHETDFGQVSAANVVVLEVEYRASAADARSPEAQTIGTGTAYVFTAGVLVRGTWTRADRTSAFELRDDSGAVIALTPGRTWVELARANHTTPTD
jgi:hypothetical protein